MTGETPDLNYYKTQTGTSVNYTFCEPHLLKRQGWYKKADKIWEVISSKTVDGVFKEELKLLK